MGRNAGAARCERFEGEKVMNVLIVDDNVQKARKLADVLLSAGITKGSISFATSANAAKDALRKNRFTLLVIDLLLPQREDDKNPTLDVAIALVDEVCERDVYRKPQHIVGFTAFPDAEQQALSQFSKRLWTIVSYDETSSNWQEEIKNLARYLHESETEAQRRSYQIDVAIIAALQTELDAVLLLPWDWSDPEPLDDSTFVRHGVFRSNGQAFTAVAAACPRMGSVAAGLVASKLFHKFSPRFAVMPGICAGVKKKVEISDVVVFDPAWEWPSGKLSDDGDGGTYLEPAPHQIALSEFVSARIEQSKNKIDWSAFDPKSVGLSEHPKVHVGPGASGSAVIADSQTVDSIRQQHRKLLAVEMEAYGIYAAARASARPRPTPIALKSVCDFADEGKADTYQSYCCRVSAEYLRQFFERHMFEIKELAGT